MDEILTTLRQRREALRLTQQEVATKAGTSQSYYGQIELGQRLPNAELRRAISAALGIHDMRHTFGSSALGQGMDIKVVSEIMGHSKVQTTMDRYQHVSLDNQRSVMDALEERIFGSDG